MAEALLPKADPDFARWVEEIARYEEESRRWQERARKIVKRYKDERDGPADENAQRYNILWSNLQVLVPAVYAKNPVPQVERRYRDDDPVGRQASEVLERCISWCLAAHAFKDVARCAVLVVGENLSGVCVIAERLREVVACAPLTVDGVPVPMTVSVGVAALNAQDQKWEDILRRADEALYHAKQHGRNRVSVHGRDLAEHGHPVRLQVVGT